MSAWARPGVKCVCVATSHAALDLGFAAPIVGRVYTIREVLDGPRFSDGVIDHGVRLVEIVNPPARFGTTTTEPAWVVAKFRPIITKTQEQDVAMFMQNLTKVGEDA